MKKKFKDTKFAKILGGVLKGATKDIIFPASGVVVGAITGLKESISTIKNENLSDEVGGVGRINWVRLVSLIGTLLLAILYAFGKLDLKTFERLIELIG